MKNTLVLSILFSFLFSNLFYKNISQASFSNEHSYSFDFSYLQLDQRKSDNGLTLEILTSFSNLFYLDEEFRVFRSFISKIHIKRLSLSNRIVLKNYYVYIYSGVSPPKIS